MQRHTSHRFFALGLLALSAAAPTLTQAQTDAAADVPAAKITRTAHPQLNLGQAGLKGEAAVAALGSSLDAVASAYGMSAQALAHALRSDTTLHLDAQGRLYVVDELDAPLQASDLALEPQRQVTPITQAALSQTFKLHSRPSAKRTIYLDFTGATLSNTAWVSGTVQAKPFSLDSDTAHFSTTEKQRIQAIWQRVAEDFAPFNVDVTTEPPAPARLTRADSNDEVYGTTVLITHNSGVYNCECGGVAYVGVFDSVGDYYKPALVFYNQLASGAEKAVAEAISHEAGHNMGLNHDGYSGGGYYPGHGSGVTGWAPIMGVGYYKPVVQWSKGEYATANNRQDDFAVMASNGLPLRADDHGNTLANATALEAVAGTGQTLVSSAGVVEREKDVDMFSFTADQGSAVVLKVSPDSISPNLDVGLRVLDASGTELLKVQPNGSLAATARFTASQTATYYLEVRGTGYGDPLSNGYSRYGSLGQYSVKGSVTP